jgi:outer membrane murein-binding lipoprotein Lpp
MRRVRGVVVRGLAVVAALSILSGCQDEQARNKANKLEKELSDLQSQVEVLQKDLKAARTDLETLTQRLQVRVNEGMQAIKGEVTKVKIELQQQITERNKKTTENLLTTLKSVRENNEKRFKTVVAVDMAQQVQKIRDDIEKLRGELIGYMDKQLKELYPYAYQPRRMDPTQPPKAPQE